MLMGERENFLRTVEMREPEWIPCFVGWQQATWSKYREKLEEIVIKHPLIFGDYKKGSVNFDDFKERCKGQTYRDEWGCVWHHFEDGLAGQVKEHPLEDWKALDSYEPPNLSELKGPPLADYLPKETWDEARERIRKVKVHGGIAFGYIAHGSLFQRIYYLRGFKNFLIDTIQQPPQLSKIVEMIVDFNMELIDWWIKAGVDVVSFGDDLGTQTRLTINPDIFRKLFIPAFTKMFGICSKACVYVHLHSDGHILEVAEDLIKAGVSILNLQDRVNEIDNIAKTCKGRVCLDIDLDRQYILPLGTPEEIESHIKQVVVKLDSEKGGLMLKADCYPDVPLTNIEAVCQALEKYRCARAHWLPF
jgi:hypothetical protein